MPRPRWILLTLLALTALAFWRIPTLQFVLYDDQDYVYQNIHVLSGLLPGNLTWAFTTFSAANYHPLTWLSLQLDAQLFGTSPGGYHVTNLLLHLANVALFWALLRRTAGGVWRPALACGLFALHPLRVESVAWVAERKDVLSVCLGLLTLLLYVSYTRRPSAGRALGVLVAFSAGLLTKPMLVTLPVLMLLLDVWPLGRTALAPPDPPDPPAQGAAPVSPAAPVRRLLLEKVPLLVLSALAGVVTVVAQRSGGAIKSTADVTLAMRFCNMPIAYCRYLLKTVWPTGLTIGYPYPAAWPAWQVGAAAGVLLAITWLVLAGIRRRPWLAVGWLWFLVALLPVIGLVQAGDQSLADRYTYLPSLGLSMMLAWSIPGSPAGGGTRRSWRMTLAALGGAWMLGLAALTSAQTAVWHDSLRLFSRELGLYPDYFLAHAAIAAAYESTGQLDLAIAHASRAIALRPDAVQPRVALGAILLHAGRVGEAVPVLREAIRIDPDTSDGHYTLGAALVRLGKSDEAIENWKRAIALAPDLAEAHQSLANALAAKGDDRGALPHFARAIDLAMVLHARRDRDSSLFLNAGRACGRLGLHDRAIKCFHEALKIKPDLAAAHNALAIELMAQDPQGALEHFGEAVELDPGNAAYRDNLERARGMAAGAAR